MNKVTLIKLIVLAVAIVNQSLVLAGYSPLPFDDAQVENTVTVGFSLFATVLAWKHQNFDKKDK